MKTISVIIPVYTEVDNIKATVQNTIWALGAAKVDNYELLIIDCLRQDGTDDGTPEIAESLAKQDSHIKVFHNSYMTLGEKYWLGVEMAHFPYVVMVAGHNKLAKEMLRDMLVHLGNVDIITSYITNTELRSLTRRAISKTFTFLMNVSIGGNLQYYNNACIHRTNVMRMVEVKDRDTSFAYMAKLLGHLIRAGYSYTEVPVLLQRKETGRTSAFTIHNFIGTGRTILGLFLRYRILHRKSPIVYIKGDRS